MQSVEVIQMLYGILAVFVAIMVIYIITVNKVQKLDSRAKDSASEIDTWLWDDNRALTQLSDTMAELGTPLPEKEKSSRSLITLGMPASLQTVIGIELTKTWQEAEELIKNNEKLSKNETITALQEKHAKLKIELMKTSNEYNRRAREFNSAISKFPASWVASRKGRRSKEFFNGVY